MLDHAPYVNFQLHWEEASLWCRAPSMILGRRRIRPIFPNVYKIFFQGGLACNVFQAFICPLISFCIGENS